MIAADNLSPLLAPSEFRHLSFNKPLINIRARSRLNALYSCACIDRNEGGS